MTAAHCESAEWSDDVIVGKHSRWNASDGTAHEVCRYIDHPKYHKINHSAKYDFTILHLKTPVEIGPRAVPACLPTLKHGGDFLAGKTLTVSGWGITLNETTDGNKLRFVKVPGITNAECEKLYKADYMPIYTVELCAGDADAGRIDSCLGDSGGNI